MNLPPQVRKILGYFIGWAFIHLVFLSLGWSGKKHDDFWPFGFYGLIESYDMSEFLVYVLGPIVIFYVLFLIFNANLEERIDKEIERKTEKEHSSPETTQQSSGRIFSDSDLKIIKYLIVSIILLSILSFILKQFNVR